MSGSAEGGRRSYVALQQVEHALLGDLFALVELLQRLLDLVVLDLPLPLLLVVEVQTASLHLLQVMLRRRRESLKSDDVQPTPRAAELTYLDLLHVFVVEVLQRIDEVLFDLHVQSVLHLPELLHGLAGVHQRQSWTEPFNTSRDQLIFISYKT